MLSAPRKPAAAAATGALLDGAPAKVTGQVASSDTPVLTQSATLNNFNARSGAPLAPGTAVQLFGANLVNSDDPIIADAMAFGVRNFDLHAALRYMVKGTTQMAQETRGYVERPGISQYLRLGFAPPRTTGIYGSAATTLEYGVDDFAIARTAAMLGVVCVCWAGCFNHDNNLQDATYACNDGELVAILTVVGIRTVIALASLGVWKPRLFLRLSRRALAVGLLHKQVRLRHVPAHAHLAPSARRAVSLATNFMLGLG